MTEESIESGLEKNPILDAFHSPINDEDDEVGTGWNFTDQEEFHLNDKLYSRLYMGCGIFFCLVATTILVMSPFVRLWCSFFRVYPKYHPLAKYLI